jgi:transcriptional regulator with XRE-family HTH domain
MYLMAKPVKKTLPLDTMNEAAAEASITAKGIGRKIRRLRLKRSMGLVELGQRVGLSASLLSQLETGRLIPTIRNLARLALEFNADLSHFLGEEKAVPFRISRAKDRNRLLVGEEGSPLLISESMSGLVPDRTIAPCIAEFLPGAGDAAFHPQMFPGVELVYVICGSLTVSAGMRMELLGTADSAWIDGNVKRLYRCHGDKPAKALILPFASDL